MKNECPSVVDDGVSGIRSALIADDCIGIASQDIYDLALAFITPLGAYDYEISHRQVSKKMALAGQWPGPEGHRRGAPDVCQEPPRILDWSLAAVLA